jgi:DNA-binding PucR family transcriptional regulator
MIGAFPVAWAVEVAEATKDAIVSESFDVTNAPVAEIGIATETSLLILLLSFMGDAVNPHYATEFQGKIVDYRVANETPFHQTVRSLRLAQHQWVDVLLAAALQRGATPEVIQIILTTIARSFDEGIDWHLSHYLAEQERQLRSESMERARVLEALVAGHEVDPQVVEARLGLDLNRHHLALILESPTGAEHRQVDQTQSLLAALARSFGGASIVAHQAAVDTIWVWIGADVAIPDRVWVARARSIVRDHGWRGGAGRARRGADGFGRSHAEALDAVRSARAVDRSLVWYPEVALVALLSADLSRARWFVQDYLQGLDGADPKSAELRTTLLQFYRSGMRLGPASEELHLHRNTLSYRLQIITKRLGHDVDKVVPEVQCALLLVEELGGSVLT